MKQIGNLMPWVGGLALLSAVACAAGPDGSEASGEGAVATAEQALGWHEVHGGDGGDTHRYETGNFFDLQLNQGSVIEALSLWRVTRDGKVNDVPGSSNGWLGSHRQPVREQRCDVDNGYYMVGVKGRVGNFQGMNLILGLGILCGHVLHPEYGLVEPPGYEGGDGTEFSDVCEPHPEFELYPPRPIVRQVVVHAGTYIDSVQIYCGEWKDNQ